MIQGHAVALTYWLDLFNSSIMLNKHTLRENIILFIIILLFIFYYIYIFSLFFIVFYYFFFFFILCIFYILLLFCVELFDKIQFNKLELLHDSAIIDV